MAPDQQRKLADLEASIPPNPASFAVSFQGAPFAAMPGAPVPLAGCAGEAGSLFVPIIIYRPGLDRLTEVLHLNAQQNNQVKALMIERRNRLLALIDETPPPSFKLGRIFQESAPMISPAPRRFSGPKKFLARTTDARKRKEDFPRSRRRSPQAPVGLRLTKDGQRS